MNAQFDGNSVGFMMNGASMGDAGTASMWCMFSAGNGPAIVPVLDYVARILWKNIVPATLAPAPEEPKTDSTMSNFLPFWKRTPARELRRTA